MFTSQTVIAKVTTSLPSVITPSECAGVSTSTVSSLQTLAPIQNQIAVGSSYKTACLLLICCVTETVLNKTTDSSKQSEKAEEEASDDEDGDDAEQDIEGSADHPSDY